MASELNGKLEPDRLIKGSRYTQAEAPTASQTLYRTAKRNSAAVAWPIKSVA